jgi:hypothetical protein
MPALAYGDQGMWWPLLPEVVQTDIESRGVSCGRSASSGAGRRRPPGGTHDRLC